MVLRHRDRVLLRFEWVEPQCVRVVSVNEAERKLLPLEMHGVGNGEALADPRFSDNLLKIEPVSDSVNHVGADKNGHWKVVER